MSETAVFVAEATRDFLGLLARAERERESAVLGRKGKRVATLNPLPTAATACAELAERWAKLEKLPPDEAGAFAEGVELPCNPLTCLRRGATLASGRIWRGAAPYRRPIVIRYVDDSGWANPEAGAGGGRCLGEW